MLLQKTLSKNPPLCEEMFPAIFDYNEFLRRLINKDSRQFLVCLDKVLNFQELQSLSPLPPKVSESRTATTKSSEGTIRSRGALEKPIESEQLFQYGHERHKRYNNTVLRLPYHARTDRVEYKDENVFRRALRWLGN